MSTSCRKPATNNADFTTKLQAVEQDILEKISVSRRNQPHARAREPGRSQALAAR